MDKLKPKQEKIYAKSKDQIKKIGKIKPICSPYFRNCQMLSQKFPSHLTRPSIVKPKESAARLLVKVSDKQKSGSKADDKLADAK